MAKRVKKTTADYYKKNSKRYYNDGNLAYELQPAEYPQPSKRPQYQPDYQPDYEQRTRRRWLQKQERKLRAIHRMKLLAAVGFVFTGCIFTMFSYATVAAQKATISNLKAELAALQSDNTALEADLIRQVDLSYIEKEATQRLGMSVPQPYQVFYIDVPKQSYTIRYNDEQVKEEEEFQLKDILDFFKKD